MSSQLYTPMLSAQTLKDQVIVITGGGTGLGKSMAQMCLQLGASVVITSRKMEVLQTTATELESLTQGRVLPVVCDVRDYRQVEQLLTQTLQTFGRVDGLVN